MWSTSCPVARLHADFIDIAKRRLLVNSQLMHPDEFDTDADDLAPMDEIEYEESVAVDTAVEVQPLVARTQGTRFSDG